ncbi:ATP-dependent helicase [Helcococcus sueciensis]|uniref:ATP-dependent helicase n=1 Tax=Helcococcus sueciensis TaxID=241555 RepID=UPI00040EC67D|nr:UvrD-helicase domain-containing protein [Helcococcus sueciensis]
MSVLLRNLNNEQKEAVNTTDGPILILAGAGSGKTTVLTRKIAYLIENKLASEFDILAFTFTNKAANEMKDRVSRLLEKNVDHMWIGTFHSICSRILRRNIEKIGYKQNFTIYDTQDSKQLVKQIMKDLKIDEKFLSIAEVIYVILDSKNNFVKPTELLDKAFYEKQRNTAQIYEEYEKRKKANNALDFDDLIIKTISLLKKDDETLNYYANKFKYVFVDEYQDTNKAQYELIKLFTKVHGNICVVGDSDQSIYSWRGADISNILNFEKDFKKAKVILLEQNYRSTTKILDSANALIKNNIERKEKNLWTDNSVGEKPIYRNSSSEYEEASDIVLKIQQMQHKGYDLSEMAILYRTNAQSRVLEEKLMENHISHKIVGGLKFYDRREVKDILAYVQFIANPDDNLSLRRIINLPKRGIGDTTVNNLEFFANQTNQSMFDAIFDDAISNELSKGAVTKLRNFGYEMQSFINLIDDYLITDLVEEIYEKSGYKKMLESSKKIEDASRIENIGQLITAVAEFERTHEDATVYDYLQNVNLLSDTDKTEDSNGISLMTIHAAKGLEYEVVFLAGMEDGLFPSLRTIEEGGLEEERRLCYVAITRAKQRLFISSASTRTMYGRSSYTKKSRFIDEIIEYLDEEKPKVQETQSISYDDIFDSFEIKRERIRQEIQEKKKRFEDSLNMKFNIGNTVMHKKFGKGMVISITEKDDGDELLVNFEKAGLKKLDAKLAKLKKI